MTKAEIKKLDKSQLVTLVLDQQVRIETARNIYKNTRNVLAQIDIVLDTGDQSKIGPKYLKLKRLIPAIRSWIPSLKPAIMPSPK